MPVPSDGQQSLTVTVTQLYQPETILPVTNRPATAYAQKFLEGEPKALGFIVSGAMCIAAEKDPSIKLLRACLTSNIASGLLASGAIIIYMSDTLDAQHCTGTYAQCTEDRELYMISYWTFAILLMFTFLQLTVSITIAVFVCKSTRCCHPYSSMPLIVHDVNIDEDP